MGRLCHLEQRSQGQALGCFGALRQLSPALRMKQIFLFVSFILKIFSSISKVMQFALKNDSTTEECDEERESLP